MKNKIIYLYKNFHHASNIIASKNWQLLSENLFKYTCYICFLQQSILKWNIQWEIHFSGYWPLLTPTAPFLLTWVMAFSLIPLSYIFTLLPPFWFLDRIQTHHNITPPPTCIPKATNKCYFTLSTWTKTPPHEACCIFTVVLQAQVT